MFSNTVTEHIKKTDLHKIAIHFIFDKKAFLCVLQNSWRNVIHKWRHAISFIDNILNMFNLLHFVMRYFQLLFFIYNFNLYNLLNKFEVYHWNKI